VEFDIDAPRASADDLGDLVSSGRSMGILEYPHNTPTDTCHGDWRIFFVP